MVTLKDKDGNPYSAQERKRRSGRLNFKASPILKRRSQDNLLNESLRRRDVVTKSPTSTHTIFLSG